MEKQQMVTMKGEPLTLLGKKIEVGQVAPGFTVTDNELREVSLEKFKGKIKVLASVPSLDTPICDLQIKRFNDEASKLSKDIIIIFISMDLPFAQKRFCGQFNIKSVKTVSDYREGDFGKAYGVLIKELRLLSRAIFVIDKDDKVSYVEYVEELTFHPDYESVLEHLKATK